MYTQNNAVWYAMRAIFREEVDMKKWLDKESIENFIPMRYSFATRNRHKARELVPTVTNLIFVHATPMTLNEMKKLIYLKPEEINLKKGTPVCIIGGTFDGVKGLLIIDSMDFCIILASYLFSALFLQQKPVLYL